MSICLDFFKLILFKDFIDQINLHGTLKLNNNICICITTQRSRVKLAAIAVWVAVSQRRGCCIFRMGAILNVLRGNFNILTIFGSILGNSKMEINKIWKWDSRSQYPILLAYSGCSRRHSSFQCNKNNLGSEFFETRKIKYWGFRL